MAVQFAREQFFIPALAPLVYNLGIILGGVLLAARFGMEGFAWGVLGGPWWAISPFKSGGRDGSACSFARYGIGGMPTCGSTSV